MEMLYVVQSFYVVSQRTVAAKPILHVTERMARTRGEVLADQCDGVVVYAQGADADRNEYSAPVVLAKYGDVPNPEAQSLRDSAQQSVRRKAFRSNLSRLRGNRAHML
ncbi:MAG: hypothetical protein ABI129_03265 [Rhodanobacter sp.]